MSQSAMPATQNDMTTCLETFEKERFCSFPHRHGEGTGNPETRDETCWSIKTSISCETSSNFHTLLQNRRFPTSFLVSLKICYLKIDVSCEASVNCQHISQNATLRACHTKRLSTRYEIRLNVTKCHACHAERSTATCETSKSDPFLQNLP